MLRGEARVVESAGQAAYLLVTCADGDGVTQLLVPTDTAGVAVAPMETVDLTRRFGLVTFDGASVGDGRRRGHGGRGEPPTWTASWRSRRSCSTRRAVGAMQTGFDMTVEWAFDRYSFGRPLASYQALKHRFADMLMWLEAAHAISDAACVAVQDEVPEAAELLSAAKAYVGEYGAELLQDCVQIHGGIGITFEHDLHLFLRRLTVDRSLAGTPADHRQRIAAIAEAGRDEVAA